MNTLRQRGDERRVRVHRLNAELAQIANARAHNFHNLLGDVPAATAVLDEALAVITDPGPRLQLLGRLATIKVFEPDLDGALVQYRRALDVDPNLADAHSELATALLSKGDTQKAEAHYLEAARLDPKRADVHSNLGSLLLRQGKTSQAIIQYEEALRIDPTLTEAAENLRVAKQSDTRFQTRTPK